MDPDAEGGAPLLEVRLELEDAEIRWAPALDEAGVRGMLRAWLAE